MATLIDAKTELMERASHKELSAKERFDVAREIIKHEDGLVNSRITWLQIFQGLLFTSFVAGIGLLKEDKIIVHAYASTSISIALCIIGALGMLASFAAFSATNAAIKQILEVERWWKMTPAAINFPPIAGSHGILFGPYTWREKLIIKQFRINGCHMLLVFIPIWAALIFLFLIAALRCLTPRSSGAPTAGHQARAGGTRYIFTGPGLASCRRSRLNSNVRQKSPLGASTGRAPPVTWQNTASMPKQSIQALFATSESARRTMPAATVGTAEALGLNTTMTTFFLRCLF